MTLNMERLNYYNEQFEIRQRIVDACKDERKLTKVLDDLAVYKADHASDMNIYFDCLIVGVKADSAAVVKTLMTLFPNAQETLSREIIEEIRSNEVGLLLLNQKVSTSKSVSTLCAVASLVADGKSKADRTILINLLVEYVTTMTGRFSCAIFDKCFCTLVQLESIDGINQMLERSKYTTYWRSLQPQQLAATEVKSSDDKSELVFIRMLQIAATAPCLSGKSQMFDALYSMLLPHPDFLEKVISQVFDEGEVNMIDINPLVFVKHYRTARWPEYQLKNFQLKMMVDPVHRKEATNFLKGLATALYLHQARYPSAATEDEHEGVKLASKLLSAEAPKWMSSIRTHHAEMIEVLLQQLPQDLVILSLRYLVGQ
jgi:hypothetical protein